VRAEGLEPGTEDLALFAEVAAGRLSTDELQERALSRYRMGAARPVTRIWIRPETLTSLTSCIM
jgi:Antitoxin VbhA